MYTEARKLDSKGIVTLVKDEKGRLYVKKRSAPEKLTTEVTPKFEGLAVRLLQNEYTCLKQINSPFVPKTREFYAYGNQASLIIDYVPGETLDKEILRLSRKGGFQAVLDAAKAVRAAHKAGVMHHDVKPENIIIGKQRAVLVDFGAAKQIGRDYAAEGLDIINGLSSGHYAAPEQRADRPTPTTATDVYLLGMTLYFVLASKNNPIEISGLAERSTSQKQEQRPKLEEFIQTLEAQMKIFGRPARTRH